MDRALFVSRFRDASKKARDFARGLIREPLPDALRYRVRLNSSYDGNPLVGDEVLYPEDSAFDKAIALHEATEEEVVETLWRDGRVPEWINLNVVGETGAATLIDVVSCGRFTAGEDHLYHKHEGLPPFHVLGPTLPVGYEDGDRFSIYDRSECFTAPELERVARHAGDVWSLELVGPAFADACLERIHPFPALEILELKYAAIEGHGLSGLARLPRLRVLRIHSTARARLDLTRLPSLPTLRTLDLTGLPAEVLGVARLGAAAGLEQLTLSASHSFALDAPLPELPSLESFSLTAPRLPASCLPSAPGLRNLSVHVGSASEADVLRAASVYPRLRTLTLHDTPLTDAFLDELDRWPSLEYLNVVGCRVTADALRQLPARRPGLRFHPRAK